MSSDVYRAHTDDPPSALARGTRLAEFEVLRVLGIGGFGIVYLAFDHALEREVAVKEYMPASLVGRTATLHVSLRSQSDADTFALGLRSFVNEARMLARFDHPSLLKVLRFWEANGTAYMAMPVLRGQTLKALRDSSGQAPDEAWLRGVLLPLLGAIETLHSAGVFHRDVSPDNIQIEPDGRPVLLDFGAARRVISDKSQNLTAILKPAYAPIEQYAEVGSLKQGPWTDIYSLGATLYYMLVGRAPMPATARSMQDDLEPLSGRDIPGCSDSFLHIIDWMLAPRPSDRPQSVPVLRDVLDGHEPAPVRHKVEPVAPARWQQTIVSGNARASVPDTVPRSTTIVDVPLGDSEPMDLSLPESPEPPVVTVATAPPPRAAKPPPVARAAVPVEAPRGRSRLLPVIGGLGALAAVAIVVAVALWPKPAAQGDGLTAAPQTMAPAPSPAASDVAVAPAPAELAPAASAPVAVTAEPRSTSPPPTVDTRPAVSRAASSPDRSVARPTVPPRNASPVLAEPTRPADVPQTTAATPPPSTAATPAPEVARSPITTPAASALPVRTVQASAADAGPAAPEATCGAKKLLAYFVCMERECLRGSLASHPDCLKWRANRPKD